MNKYYKIIASIIVILSVILCGCNSESIKYDKLYTEYIYVGTDSVFIESGRTLAVNSDGTFNLTFDENMELKGVADHIKREQTIYLDCDESAAAAIKQMYKDEVLNDPENAIPLDILNTILASVDISEEIHYYNNYMFSTSFISAHRYIDTSLYSYGEDYSVFEGVYSVMDYDGLMLLRNGEIYVQDTDKPVAGSFPVFKGTYIIANDFITMTINDPDGKPQAPQKYLVADLILPFELTAEQTDDAEWNEALKDQLDELSGKKIKVLVLCFFVQGTI